MREDCRQKITVALAGNPNVGKSTLFNALTGQNQHTGNWPGKTVAVAQGTVYSGDICYTFVDLPGTYSLDGKTEDEQIAGDYLKNAQSDCTVIVCDGSCLERSLILALKILPLCTHAVVCVNLMDEARKRGITVDEERLSQKLNVPTVCTAAGKKEGLARLLQEIERTVRAPGQLSRRWEDPVTAAEEIVSACVKKEKRSDYRLKTDRLLVSRRFGVPLMFLLLLFIIWLTVWGANYPSRLLERAFGWGHSVLYELMTDAPWWLRGILLDGIYATATRVMAVMLPPMAIFFPLFTLLEDIGYLPRMAFLLDPCMARCGGCGKQALTLCMGLGCNAVGVMGCRIIESPRERLAAILTNAMVPCNGRFPTLILLGTLFFPEMGAALVVAACVALGAAGAVTVSGVLSKTVLRSKASTFLMEIPPFRCPRLGKILKQSLLERTLLLGLRALRVAAPAGAVLWILSVTGSLSILAELLEPLGGLMGMNGILLLAFFLALPANELVIPVALTVMTGAGSLQTADTLSSQILLSGGMDRQMAVCTMVFTLFHWPCATTLMTVYRETGSAKKTLAAFLLPTAAGMLLCIMLHLLLFRFF